MWAPCILVQYFIYKAKNASRPMLCIKMEKLLVHARILSCFLILIVSRLKQFLNAFPSKFILYTSSSTITLFLLLHHDEVDGSPVPTVVFKDRPTAYQAFLISTVIAFTAAFCAILVQHRPKFESFCRVSAMVSLVSAYVIVCFTVAFSNSWHGLRIE